MKRTIFTALILIGMISVQAQNVETTRQNFHQNQFLFSPFHFFDGTFMLSYERMMPNGNAALRITPSITLSNVQQFGWWGDEDRRIGRQGFGLDVGYKFFLLNNPRRFNFYVGPYAMFRQINNRFRYLPTERIDVLGMGVDAGMKMTFGRFVMDFTLGGGLRYAMFEGSENHSTPDIFDDKYRGIMPRANFVLGILF